MQTKDMAKKKTAQHGLQTRFALVRGFLMDRGARNYLSVFAACGEKFGEEDAERIWELWNSRARVTDNDLPLIERMERVIAHLRTA